MTNLKELLNGWLRRKGDQFFAYSRPNSVIMDMETGETMEDQLHGRSFTDLFNSMKALEDKVQELEAMVIDIVETAGTVYKNNGIYTVQKLVLEQMLTLGVVDEETMYVFCDSVETTARVATEIRWYNKDNQIVKKAIHYTKIGVRIDEKLWGEFWIDGVCHIYDQATSPLIDMSLDKESRQLLSTGEIMATKNVILRLNEI